MNPNDTVHINQTDLQAENERLKAELSRLGKIVADHLGDEDCAKVVVETDTAIGALRIERERLKSERDKAVEMVIKLIKRHDPRGDQTAWNQADAFLASLDRKENP